MARTHVILDDEVMAAIDQRVGHRGRSRFLEEAAQEKLARLAQEEAIREGAGALAGTDHPEWADQAAINEWVRSQRRTERAS